MSKALNALIVRMDELESQVAFQAELNDSLDATVARQDREIHEMKRQLESLRERLREFGEAIPGFGPQDETPPHY